MSEPTKIPPIVFVNTLHDNPSAQYPKFLREAKQISFRLLQEYVGYPAGLIFLVITLAEYNLIPQVTVGGVLQPPNIPVFPANPGAAATASELELYRQEARMCTIHWQVVEAFKTAVLVAMGEDLVQEVADPLAGEAVTMETLDIFIHLNANYGVLTSADVRALKMELTQPISSDDTKTFIKFAANFSTIVLRLETAGQALPAFEQMELLTIATEREFEISKAIDKYVDNNPILARRSLPDMIAAVRTSLSNVNPTATNKAGFSALTRNLDRQAMVDEIFGKVFADKFAEIDARIASAMQQKSPTVSARGSVGGTAGSQRRSFVPAYCFLHGNRGHPGSQCRIMLSDRSKFTNAMLKAKTPTDVAGGSTKG